ncbi:MAG: CehA/McbA family metallohydrolase [Firmicutes bacterium]|nr:CehA/McbA family metallohydrolase [Bacillota bacterium]MCL5038627.1 CehA/McbA family metallohydrolase [Bacillota bacterium]
MEYILVSDFYQKSERFSLGPEGTSRAIWDCLVSMKGHNCTLPFTIWLKYSTGTPAHKISVTIGDALFPISTSDRSGWARVGSSRVPEEFVEVKVEGYPADGVTLRALLLTNDAAFEPPANLETADDLDLILYGKIDGMTIISPQKVEAGSFTTLELTFRVGEGGIPTGARLAAAITSPPWPRPQIDDPTGEGYVTVSTTGQAKVSVREIVPPKDRTVGREYLIILEVRGQPLKEGDMVVIVYGDAAQGGKGIRVPIIPFAYEEVRKAAWYTYIVPLALSIDLNGDGTFVSIPQKSSHRLLVQPGAARKLVVTAPSHVKSDREFEIHIAVLDKHNNLCSPPYQGRVVVSSNNEAKLPLEYLFSGEEDSVACFKMTLSQPGVHTFTVTDPQNRLLALSNPVFCFRELPRYRLFWGEIHAHSGLGDGIGSAKSYYRHGRDVAKLDFCSLSEHSGYMTETAWEYLQACTARFHEPGRFVTLNGYEWGGRKEQNLQEGHRNVYSLLDRQPLYRGNTANSRGLERLFSLLHGRSDALVIPHHPLVRLSWHRHDPSLERVIEVYSMWGCSEKRGGPMPPHQVFGLSVQEVLAQGAKLGFICGSDNHDARPGVSGVGAEITSIWDSQLYKSGLTAVYATELTRKGIFEALRSRRVYGTTGERIIVEFSVNKHLMGEEFTQPRGLKREINARVVGTAGIASLEVVRDGKEVFQQKGHGTIGDIQWEDDSPLDDTSYYYLRVTQEDGGMAWASPVWVTPEEVK